MITVLQLICKDLDEVTLQAVLNTSLPSPSFTPSLEYLLPTYFWSRFSIMELHKLFLLVRNLLRSTLDDC